MLPNLRQRSKSELDSYSHFNAIRQSLVNQEIFNSLIKIKIGSYTKMHLPEQLSILKKNKKKYSQMKKGMKIFHNSNDLPKISSLSDLIEKQKIIHHLYREKLQIGFEQCFLFYLQIISAAIRNQCILSADVIQKERSPMIQCFIFVAQSLFEMGYQKLSFFFAVKGVLLCQFYQKYLQMGKLLYLMGKIARKIGRVEHSLVFLKKSLQYLWYDRKHQSLDIEVQVYDQLSHNFLQMNMLFESKIFAQKYEIGYTQKNNSKIIQLSKQLVTSVQNRKIMWHAITYDSMELLMSFSIANMIKQHQAYFSGKVQQKKVLDLLKINFDYLWDTFLQNDMFFYEIPLPLELIQIQKPKSFSKAKPATSRFIPKKRSKSTNNLKILNRDQNQKVKQFMIFNYRGVGVSKHKMCNKLKDFTQKLKNYLYQITQK